MKILFLVPYPHQHAPSQRFRFEQYMSLLQAQGYQYEIHSFLVAGNWRLFMSPGRPLQKLIAVLGGFWRRTMLMFGVNQFDRIFIHREAAPIGPPVFEWLIAKGFKKKIIYDFDDAIWLTDRSAESWIGRMLRWRSKVATICRLSYRVSCGNSYLAAFASNYCSQVIVNPTTVVVPPPKSHEDFGRESVITIGWTGTKSTLKYLEPLREIISELMTRYGNVRFCIIADERPTFDSPAFTFVTWSREAEVEDLGRFDIGIMPLPDDEWSKGKCGAKALQYMAVGIPAVVSPVGVNTQIIEHGKSGMLASSPKEWMLCLEKLIADASLRKSIGDAGREKVKLNYSPESNRNLFLSLLT